MAGSFVCENRVTTSKTPKKRFSFLKSDIFVIKWIHISDFCAPLFISYYY